MGDITRRFPKKRVKSHIYNSVKLAHIREDHLTFRYTEESQYYWAAIFTQLRRDQPGCQPEEQEHEALYFLAEKFSGNSERWNTLEKEVLTTIEEMGNLEHISIEGEIHVFKNHANIIYIFDPFVSNPGISRNVAQKLIRWEINFRLTDTSSSTFQLKRTRGPT